VGPAPALVVPYITAPPKPPRHHLSRHRLKPSTVTHATKRKTDRASHQIDGRLAQMMDATR
jgi:hypothetical protein